MGSEAKQLHSLFSFERTRLHTTCPNHFCNYRAADLHETDSHVVIYCQSCGYEEAHKRKNASSRPAHKPRWEDSSIPTSSRKIKKKPKSPGLIPRMQAI